MRLVTYQSPQGPAPAALTDAGLVPFSALGAGLPASLDDLVAGGAAALSRLRAAVDSAPASAAIDPASVTLLAPIPRPRRNIFCVGKNYHEHAREFQGSGFDASSQGQVIPDVPIIFTKATTSVTGPGAAIDSALDPDATVDYEGELAVIIGTPGRGIPTARAMDHVWGYTIINDVTARATQLRHKQWFLGKSTDTFCPMGPCLVTADAVPDVGAMRLTSRVNGELRQNVPVSDLIFDIPTIIAALSVGMTLEPGDIIATGTPAGVGIGFKPPRYLKAGDVVTVEVTGIGVLENPVV
jgi:2-keto-4-pentenoate hydratase/2-oxohepta-3-ene-1,7-dioic acid hydratase in catechol pathway